MQPLTRREQLEQWKRQRQTHATQQKITAYNRQNKENLDTQKKQNIQQIKKLDTSTRSSNSSVRTTRSSLRETLKEIDRIEDKTKIVAEPSLLLPHVSMIEHADDDMSDEEMDEALVSSLVTEQPQQNEYPFFASPIIGEREFKSSDWSSLLETPLHNNSQPRFSDASSIFVHSFEEPKGSQDISYYIRKTLELEAKLNSVTKERNMWKEKYLTLRQEVSPEDTLNSVVRNLESII